MSFVCKRVCEVINVSVADRWIARRASLSTSTVARWRSSRTSRPTGCDCRLRASGGLHGQPRRPRPQAIVVEGGGVDVDVDVDVDVGVGGNLFYLGSRRGHHSRGGQSYMNICGVIS